MKKTEIISPHTAFIEPVPIIPTYCDGVAHIDVIAGAVHYTLYVEQRSFHGDGPREKVICGRVIMSLQGAQAAYVKAKNGLILPNRDNVVPLNR